MKEEIHESKKTRGQGERKQLRNKDCRIERQESKKTRHTGIQKYRTT